MKILVVGLGFVGLTTALGLADKGFKVWGYDINRLHVEKIQRGIIPFKENTLPEVLNRTLDSEFCVLKDIEELDIIPDAVFFCVGTPCDDTGNADLQYLKRAIEDVIKKIDETTLLIIKSTVPPGTVKNEVIPYVRSLGYRNCVVVNPEFLREGYCWKDFTKPDRIVCGIDVNDSRSEKVLREIYEPFQAPIHFVTENTAEFIKYLSNSLLATLISFSNEMAAVAENAGEIAIGEAFKILHEDERLKDAGISHYIYPGCGYGGYCLPKDTKALIQKSRSNGYAPKILQEVVSLNENIPKSIVTRINKVVEGKNEKIGVLGLSFKPNSDDVRESSAAKIINELLLDGYKEIYVYDPVANDNFNEVYDFPINFCSSKEEVCDLCTIVILVTIWSEFRAIDKKYPNIKWVDCRYFL